MTDAADCDPVAVATAVLTVPGVASLSSGPAGLFRTVLPARAGLRPGGRTDGSASVPGVLVDDDAVTLHLVARYGVVLAELGEAAYGAVAGLVGSRQVRVCVDDLVLPGDPEPPDADVVVVPDAAGDDGDGGDGGTGPSGSA